MRSKIERKNAVRSARKEDERNEEKDGQEVRDYRLYRFLSNQKEKNKAKRH